MQGTRRVYPSETKALGDTSFSHGKPLSSLLHQFLGAEEKRCSARLADFHQGDLPLSHYRLHTAEQLISQGKSKVTHHLSSLTLPSIDPPNVSRSPFLSTCSTPHFQSHGPRIDALPLPSALHFQPGSEVPTVRSPLGLRGRCPAPSSPRFALCALRSSPPAGRGTSAASSPGSGPSPWRGHGLQGLPTGWVPVRAAKRSLFKVAAGTTLPPPFALPQPSPRTASEGSETPPETLPIRRHRAEQAARRRDGAASEASQSV